MATTSPDDLRTPDPTDSYNLVSDLQTLASDVQNALTRRANSYRGTSTQRIAFTSAAPEGSLWQDTNLQKTLWRKEGASWVRVISLAAGTGTISSLPSNTAVTANISFGGTITSPIVLANANAPVAWNPQPTIRVLTTTSTGATIQMYSGTARTNVSFDWIATSAT